MTNLTGEHILNIPRIKLDSATMKYGKTAISGSQHELSSDSLYDHLLCHFLKKNENQHLKI